MNEIHFPTEWIPHSFEEVSGAIDCSAHYRNRIHPGQALLYRGDKHAHFLSAQVVTSLQGVIYSVHIGLGHNNDKGMLLLSNMKEYLGDNNLKWLADNGK